MKNLLRILLLLSLVPNSFSQGIGVWSYNYGVRAALTNTTLSGMARTMTVPQFVDKSSDLANADGLLGPLMLQTRGAFAIDDGGDAVFAYTSDTNKWPILNGAVIASADGGRYVAKEFRDYRIARAQMFGIMDPNGVTNAAAAIQAAIDAVQAYGVSGLAGTKTRGWVVLPPGWFKVTDTIVMQIGGTGTGSVGLIGAGENRTVLNATWNDGRTILHIKDQSAFHLKDLKIRGLSGSKTNSYNSIGLFLEDCPYAVIRDVSIEQCGTGRIVDNWAGSYADMGPIHISNCGLGTLWMRPGSGGDTTWYGSNSADQKGRVPFRNIYNTEGAGGDANYDTANSVWGSSQSVSGPSYGESGSLIPMKIGVPVTNWVDVAVETSTNVIVTFRTARHMYSSDRSRHNNHYKINFSSAHTEPDVTNNLHGERFIYAGGFWTNWVRVAATNITTDISGTTFTVWNDRDEARVENMHATLIGVNKTIQVDDARNVTLWMGTGAVTNAVTFTAKSHIDPTFIVMTGNQGYSGDTELLPPMNLFPDPQARSGNTNIWGGFVTGSIRGNMVWDSTNSVETEADGGPNGSWKTFPTTNTSSATTYTVVRRFIPAVPVTAGDNLFFSLQLKQPSWKAWRPTAFGVSTAGSSYVDGVGVITNAHGNLVYVTLTTSGGNITGASWNFGYFAIDDTNTVHNVMQGNGAGDNWIFRVASGGSGYINGPAVIDVDGDPVIIGITVTGDAINGATWTSGSALVTDPTATFAVVQGDGVGGTVSVGAINGQIHNTTQTEVSWSLGGYGTMSISLANQANVSIATVPTPRQTGKWLYLFNTGVAPAGTTGLRVRVFATAKSSPGGLTGHEELNLDDIFVGKSANGPWQPQVIRRGRDRQAAMLGGPSLGLQLRGITGIMQGAPASFADGTWLYSEDVNSVAVPKVMLETGTNAPVMLFHGITTTTPTVPGLFKSNTIWYVSGDGTNWDPIN